MDKQEINSLVVSYQNGNENALERIFQAVNPLIERASIDLEHLVTDVTKFDCRMILKVKRLTETFVKDKHDFISGVKALISNEKSDFIKRRSKHLDEVSLDYLEHHEVGHQFEDPQADIESDILLKEKVALLAQDDDRKFLILLEWSKGANDKSISELLAQHFGGKAESHRKFIARFKTDCRNYLSEETTL